MLKITKILFLAVLALAFQSCGEDTVSTTDSSVTAPSTYTFDDADGATTVSYSGQTVRNMLIDGIKDAIGSGSTDLATLTALFNNTDATATYPDDDVTYHSVNDAKYLAEKIADDIVEGYGVDPTTLLTGASGWFTAGASGKVTDDGVNVDQMAGKGLLGMVGYYQATSVYLPRLDAGGAGSYTYDNSSIVSGKNYTQLEHYWDEAFGYFGATQNYGTLVGGRDSRKLAGSPTSADDYITSVNFEWAKYAAKRSDCASCTTTDFDTKIFDAFKLGRAMITAKESRTDIAAQRAIILEEWEKVIAANIVHYANDVVELMNGTFVSDGVTLDAVADCSADSKCNKYWSEMRAFGLCMQFNESSAFAMSAEFTAMIAAMGTTPPTTAEHAAFKTGVTATNAAFKTAFGFSDADITNF